MEKKVQIEQNYRSVKKKYALLGVDVDKALAQLQNISL